MQIISVQWVVQYIYSKVEICHLSLIFFLSVDERLENLTVNKKTPEGMNTGYVGVSKNYRYIEWQKKVE